MWSSFAKFGCLGSVSVFDLSRLIHTGHSCVLKDCVQLCVLCGVFLERELPNGNGHINVQLHDVLAITPGFQHFRFYWRSGQALD